LNKSTTTPAKAILATRSRRWCCAPAYASSAAGEVTQIDGKTSTWESLQQMALTASIEYYETISLRKTHTNYAVNTACLATYTCTMLLQWSYTYQRKPAQINLEVFRSGTFICAICAICLSYSSGTPADSILTTLSNHLSLCIETTQRLADNKSCWETKRSTCVKDHVLVT
jgi:hypothetical protein